MARSKQTARVSSGNRNHEILRRTYRQQQDRHGAETVRPPRGGVTTRAGSSRVSQEVVTIASDSGNDSEDDSEDDSGNDREEYTPENFRSLYPLREQWGDVTFKLAGSGRKIKASKIVLVTNCKHFETMFTSGFSENTDSVIQIQGTTPEAFEYLIKYCYYGNELFNGPESDMARLVDEKVSGLSFVFEFMKLCDKYNLPNVARKTAERVSITMSKRSPEIAVFILVQAFKADCVCDHWLNIVAILFQCNFRDIERFGHNIEEWKKLIRVNTTPSEYTELYTAILEKALQPLSRR
tara:strand:+ start:60 stop:944 length:885 start_codon:yes stop_codon:yes gene_type:complete